MVWAMSECLNGLGGCYKQPPRLLGHSKSIEPFGKRDRNEALTFILFPISPIFPISPLFPLFPSP